MAIAGTPAEQADVQLQRAQALLEMGRHKDAIPLLADALRLNPENVDTYCHLGWALYLTGDSQQSKSLLDEAIRVAPNNEWPHRLQSIAYREQGHHEAALSKAREAHRLAPDTWQTLHTLSDALLSSRKFEEAQDVAERLRQAAPDNSSTFSLLGRIALAREQLLEAERHFREALRLDPQNVYAHNNLGSTLMEQGRVKEAVAHFDNALAINPTMSVAQSNLYLGARKLRGQTWLASSRNLLLRISPKAYHYYLHREQTSFRIFFFVFLWKFVAPLTVGFVLLALGIRWATGDVDVAGIAWSGLFLAVFFLCIARLGWAKAYFEPSATQVQILTTLSAWLFSPLTLAGVGVVGLIFDPSRWVTYLLMTIVGVTFFGRQTARKVRGFYYGLAATLYPKAVRLRARYDDFVASTRAGRCIRRVTRAFRNPLFYIVVGFLGSIVSGGEGFGALWISVTYAGLMFGLFRGLRYIQQRSRR